MAGAGFDLSAHTFRDQSLRDHVAILGVSALLGFVSYVYLAGFIGGPGGVAGDGAAAVRRTALALSGMVVGLYLAVGFVRGLGGPLLNPVYLLAHLLLTPVVAVYVGGGTLPSDLLFGGPLPTPGTLLDVALVLLLPLSVYLLTQALVFRHRYSSAERIGWAVEHLPEGYRGSRFDPSRYDRKGTGDGGDS